MNRHALENVDKVGRRIDIVKAAGPDKAVQDRSFTSAVFGEMEHPVLSPSAVQLLAPRRRPRLGHKAMSSGISSPDSSDGIERTARPLWVETLLLAASAPVWASHEPVFPHHRVFGTEL